MFHIASKIKKIMTFILKHRIVEFQETEENFIHRSVKK